MAIDHLTERSEATRYLAESLSDGTLTLFLGAGASLCAGLPTWPHLIRGLRDHVGLPSAHIQDDASADVLQHAADEVRDKLGRHDREFARLVNEVMYSGVALSADLLRSELLIAVGALLAGSRRGNVKRVMTLNFDSTLEWYLSLYGLTPRVVRQPLTLEGSEDVRIYHPHGFLPHDAMRLSRSDFVILGFEHVNLRIGTRGEPWFELMRHTLCTSVCLFVGLSYRSFEDRAIAPLLAATKEELGRAGVDRPTGFWLCESSPAGARHGSPDPDATRRAAFLRANVVPIFWRDTAEIPEFLLQICQRAAKPIAP